MIRNRLSARFIDAFVKEGRHQQRIDNAVLLAPSRKVLFDVQKFVDRGQIEHSTMELVKIRASQMNGCAFCLSMHTRDALKAGERADRIATLGAWRETGWFTSRERAALAWTEAVTDVSQHQVTDALWDQCAKEFSNEEMVDLTMAIIAINSWNRLSIAFGTLPEPFEPAN